MKLPRLQNTAQPFFSIPVFGIGSKKPRISKTLSKIKFDPTQGSYDLILTCFIWFIWIFSSVESVQELTERNRIAFILRELCSRLSGETLFCSLSRKLNELPVSSKSISIVQLLNLLISTAPQLFSLRQNLQNESESVFPTLWECWTQCPISSLSLALLGKRYSLAYQVN